MSGEPPDTWPPDVALRIDAACCRFEERLRAGETPRVEDYLAGFDGPEREVVRAELVAVQIQWLARGDARVRVLSPGTRWFGLTHRGDFDDVRSHLRRLVEDGIYPAPLWGATVADRLVN